MDFEAIADELYGLAPEDFTGARNERVKQARTAKDRPLADRIASLRKPTMAAWVTNALVRSHGEEVELLLELGRELRDVMADIEGDELRELTRQRYQLVSALVQQARSLAQARGRRITDEVAQAVRTTLEATLSNQDSADAVAGGRLTDGLQVSGFSTPSPGDGTRIRPRPSRQRPDSSAGADVADLEEERKRRARAEAERDVAAAEKAAQRAGVAVERSKQRVDTAEREREEASTAVDRLAAQLEEARAELGRRTDKAQEARSDSDEAHKRARQAEKDLEQARATLDGLPG
ncbi:MAG: hypothetical protein QOD35_3049 [Nocardioidaceae bacterium]|nr:hypothetical protein [Nocardioidaceae bacterium]